MRHADVAESQHGSRNQKQDSRKLKVRFTEWQKAKNPFIWTDPIKLDGSY
jgi:hypothetical protein